MAQLPELSTSTEEKGLDMSATEIQQQFYECMGDADWELYGMKERKYLLQKVAIALCGPPTKEGNLMLTNGDSSLQNHNETKLEGYGPREEETCMSVFKKICEQSKYSHNGENVLISLVRIVLVTPKDVGFFKKNPKDHWNNLELKKGEKVTICVFHVFCVRRCTMVKSKARSCRIYIDHDGRVYKTWQSYLDENTLPKGIMVVPENGEYRGAISLGKITSENCSLLDSAEMPRVKLTVVPSPALGIGAKVLKGADITSTVANVGAVGALIGAAFATPVVAPVLITGAVGTGVVTGIYAIVRSSMHLADRGQHEQKIDLKDSEARSSWINIIMSTVGISFSAAAKLVAWAAASGTNIRILMNALTVLKYTNIATGFVGITNNLGDMIYKWNKYNETPSGTEIFQFTTSVLFFGIGVMSNATAQEIVQDAQATTINEARDALSSNVKRKAFDKVTAENRRTLGTINGNAETIKALKVISNKDDFFAKLSRINKDMNKNKVRVSVTSDGKTLINNQHKVSLSKLYGMGKGGRNKLFSKLGPADTSTKNAPTRIYASTYGGSSSTFTTKSLKICVSAEEIITISQFLTKLCKADQEFVAELLSHLSAEIHDIFLSVCVNLVSCLVPGDSHFNTRVVYFIFDYVKSKVPECDYDNDRAVVIIMKSWIKNGIIDKEIILMLKQRFMDSITDRAKVGDFHNDPLNYDYIQEFRKRYKKFLTLRAGEEISIKGHTFVVKAATVETLEEWLQEFSQPMCDSLLEFTFKVVSKLSTDEVYFLNLINPDEDIIMRVVHYLFNEVIVYNLLEEFIVHETIPDKVVEDMKDGLIVWRCAQNVRNHKICESCCGLIFE